MDLFVQSASLRTATPFEASHWRDFHDVLGQVADSLEALARLTATLPHDLAGMAITIAAAGLRPDRSSAPVKV